MAYFKMASTDTERRPIAQDPAESDNDMYIKGDETDRDQDGASHANTFV